ncbi:hypothetical protein PINS_up017303 [Pythium insidiosum]|nr:hypothetical protein PINS_up017303 [Pythium insidiosum]
MGDKSGRHLYLVSFYSMMLVIMGQNIDVVEDGEYAFCIAGMLFGAVLMAVVFGNVAILIANYYENQSSHQKKMEWLFASMSRMKLPLDLQNRINDYYQAMWERHGTRLMARSRRSSPSYQEILRTKSSYSCAWT